MGPGGITTSKGEMIPTLAGAETLLDSMMGFKVATGWLVKMKPTFSLINPNKDSNSGITLLSLRSYKKAKSSSSVSNSFNLKETAFLMMVFFPITRCVSPIFSMLFLIYWHYKDPTLVRVTAIT